MLFVNSLKLYLYHKNCTEVQMCGYSVSFIKILCVLIYHSYLAKSFCFSFFPLTKLLRAVEPVTDVSESTQNL